MCKLKLWSLVLLLSLISPSGVAAPAPELWPFWAVSDESSSAGMDHAPWQALLDRYVSPGADGINRVDYDGVTERDRQRLQAYLQTLSLRDPRSYARAEQLAYWVNLYNALTVQIVLSNPGQDSILRMGKRWFSIGPWDEALITIAGEPVTLNDIEHRILRPIWKDPRIHYALNCASLSCPNLDVQAYTRANSEGLLAANEIAYINHSRGVRFDARGRLVVSRIYDWYAADFADDPEGMLNYLGRHHAALGREISTYRGKIRYAYDWGLNRLAERSSEQLTSTR